MRGAIRQGATGRAAVPENLHAVSLSSYVAAKLNRDGDAAGHVICAVRGCVTWAVGNRDFFCLVSGHAGNLPHGVVVGGMERTSTLDITLGTPVRMNRSEIRFGGGSLRINLAEAASWSPALAPTRRAPWHPPCVQQASDVLSHAPNRRALAHLFPYVRELAAGTVPRENFDLIEQRLVSGLRRIVAAIRDRDGIAFLSAATLLVGTGVGLTPSGDDVLLGAICGLMARGALTRPSKDWLATPLRTLPKHLQGRTTAVSEAFLLHAIEGRFPERLLNFVNSLESGDAATVEDAAQALSTFGSSSGHEIALGTLVAGMAFDNSGHQRRQCVA